MINIKLLYLSFMFVVFTVLYFSGCSQHNDINSPGSPGMNNMNYNSAQFTVLDYTDFNNGINDATLDNDMAFDNSLNFFDSSGFIILKKPKNNLQKNRYGDKIF
jgi:hypothetical protein